MRIIAESRIREFADQYPEAKEWLYAFIRLARDATWRNVQELRKTYPTADAVTVASGRTVVVINVKGNTYRLIVAVHYNTRRLYIRDFMTHAEYSRDAWKKKS